MSIDEAGSEKTFPASTPESKRKSTRVALVGSPAKVRKHQIDTTYKGSVVELLDKLHAAGSEVLSITASPDVRGFEVISYTEK